MSENFDIFGFPLDLESDSGFRRTLLQDSLASGYPYLFANFQDEGTSSGAGSLPASKPCVNEFVTGL